MQLASRSAIPSRCSIAASSNIPASEAAAAVERHLSRLARDRWKARQNPRTIVHGGRELLHPC
jgi:hypothetical protein